MRTTVLLLALLAVTGCADARGCFVPDTQLPVRATVLAKVNNGAAGRDLVAAVFDGDAETASRLLKSDPRLRDTRGGPLGDLLSIAVATCSKPMVERLLAAGVPAAGPAGSEPPLTLALRATEAMVRGDPAQGRGVGEPPARVPAGGRSTTRSCSVRRGPCGCCSITGRGSRMPTASARARCRPRSTPIASPSPSC